MSPGRGRPSRAAAEALAGGAWPLVSAASMRALDHHTIERLGVPGELLMESAGRAVTAALLAERGRSGAPVWVLCGAGSNGGDGLVVARQLELLGVPVRVSLLGEARALRGDAAANLRRARAAGVALEGPRSRPPAGAWVVDALFGTGLSRPVEGPAAAAVRRLRSARARDAGLRVLAVDLPSGVCADTGAELGTAVQADCTVTLGLPKRGLALEPGRSRAGRIRVARIGIADDAPGVTHDALLWTRAAAGAALPTRPADAHKGSFGHVLLVAGSEGKTGAAALAAAGAGRMGAGLVTLACPAGLSDVLEVKCTEAMTVGLPDTSERALAARGQGQLERLARERDAVGLGPGLGEAAETRKLVQALAPELRAPLAVDADGLNALVGALPALRRRREPTVLTPHPGEAARLLGCRPAEVNRDRLAAARRLAEESGCVVLLKGAASVSAAPDGRARVNPTGGPALASGGTGDVLLGAVTALLAQGLPALEAASLAAFVHGAAADALAARHGSSGLLAGDLAAALPDACLALGAAADGAPALGSSLAPGFPEP